MSTTAKDIMTTKFHALLPNMPLMDAVKVFQTAGKTEKRQIFGLMVTDEKSQLVGMLSMYDILLYMRPKHIHIWGMMDDMDVAGVIDNACQRVKSILVGDIMSTEIITVTPQTHVMMILDIMIKKHIRRIPVLENKNILGIVYISDLFYYLVRRLTG